MENTAHGNIRMIRAGTLSKRVQKTTKPRNVPFIIGHQEARPHIMMLDCIA